MDVIKMAYEPIVVGKLESDRGDEFSEIKVVLPGARDSASKVTYKFSYLRKDSPAEIVVDKLLSGCGLNKMYTGTELSEDRRTLIVYYRRKPTENPVLEEYELDELSDAIRRLKRRLDSVIKMLDERCIISPNGHPVFI